MPCKCLVHVSNILLLKAFIILILNMKKEFHKVLDYLVVSQKRIKPQYVLLGTPPASFRMSEMVAPHKRHALILMGPENGTSLGEKVPENLINS